MPDIKKLEHTRLSIFCLFSIANDYDQPPNNLECFWTTKPTIEQVARGLEIDFPCYSDVDTLAVITIWKGEKARISNVDYRIESIQSK